MAVLSQQSKIVKTLKFTSKGHVAKPTVEPEESKEESKETKKESQISGNSKEQEGDSDEDTAAKLEQMA